MSLIDPVLQQLAHEAQATTTATVGVSSRFVAVRSMSRSCPSPG